MDSILLGVILCGQKDTSEILLLDQDESSHSTHPEPLLVYTCQQDQSIRDPICYLMPQRLVVELWLLGGALPALVKMFSMAYITGFSPKSHLHSP